MLDSDLLYELKKQHGSLFQTSIKNQLVVFRELKFSEFDRIAEYQLSGEYTNLDIEDFIIKSAVVYPADFNVDTFPTGMISSLAEEILEESGFSSAKKAKNVLELKRMQASEVRSLMKAFVLATITTYSSDDLDNMTYTKLAENVALSEKIIEIKQNILGIQPTNVTIQLVDPEEEAEKEKDFANRFNQSRKVGEAVYEDPVAQKLWGLK
jgi:hypothetical protein